MGNTPPIPKAPWYEGMAGMDRSWPTAGPLAPAPAELAHGIPVGDVVREQAAKGPDDPAHWLLNTVQDLGIVSADAVQSLTTPGNLVLLGAMAAGGSGAIPTLLKLGFTAEMAKRAVDAAQKGVAEAKKGNYREAGRLLGSAGVNTLLMALAQRTPKGAKSDVIDVRATKPAAKLQLGAGIETPPVPRTAEVPLPTVQDAELAPKTESAAVPPPPDLEAHPKPIRSGGKAVSVTPDDVRAYVSAKILSDGGVRVQTPDGDVVSLSEDSHPEVQRVRDQRISRQLFDELLGPPMVARIAQISATHVLEPRIPYKPGETVGQAVDRYLEAKSKIKLPGEGLEPPKPEEPENLEQKPEKLSDKFEADARIDLQQRLARRGFRLTDDNRMVPIEGGELPNRITPPSPKPQSATADQPGVVPSPPGGGTPLQIAVEPEPKATEPVPPAPGFQLTAPKPRPTVEPGWKLSLGSYTPAQAEKYKKAWAPHQEAVRLIPDPAEKGRYWVAWKPRAQTTAIQGIKTPPPPIARPAWESVIGAERAPERVGRAQIPAHTGPDPALWEDREQFLLRRLKELNGEQLAMLSGEMSPAQEAHFQKLDDERQKLNANFDQLHAQREAEAAKPAQGWVPATTPRTPVPHFAGGSPISAPTPQITPAAPPSTPIPEPTPEEKARQEVIRSGTGVNWVGLHDTAEGQRVLVEDPHTKATLSLPAEGLTKAAIETAVEQGRARYDAARNPDEELPVGPTKPFVFERSGFLYAGEKKIPVEFGYMERKDIEGSHDYRTFTRNPNHPGQQRYSYENDQEQQADLERFFMQPEPEQVLSDAISGIEGPPILIKDGAVAGGNKRTMWVNKMYDSKEPYAPIGGISRAKMLRDATVKVAQRNDVAGVEEMKEPVRVRRIAAPATMGEWMDLTGKLNVNMSAEPKPGEQALFYAGRITPSTLAAISGALQELNPDASIRQFMAAYPVEFVDWLQKSGAITPAERLKYVDTKTGGLNENGKMLFENALLAKVLNDARLIDSAPQQVVSTLASSLAPILRIGVRGGEWDIRPLLMQAAEVMGEAQKEGIPLQTKLDQKKMFTSGPGSSPPIPLAVRALAEFLDRDIPLVKKGMRQFAAESEVKGGTGQASFIAQDPEPFDSFKAAFTQPIEVPEPRDKKGNIKEEKAKAKEKRLRENEESRRRMAIYHQLTKEDYENALREAHEATRDANRQKFREVRPGDSGD